MAFQRAPLHHRSIGIDVVLLSADIAIATVLEEGVTAYQ